ncbi:MAG: hypothetical protein ACPW61_06970 [Methyloligella sp. ZOD6]
MMRILYALLLIFCSVGAAQAGELVDNAKRAEEAAAAGKPLKAYNEMRKGMLSLWRAGPLTFRKALFVTGQPSGFGLYQAKAKNVFEPGEELIAYVEPVGFSWKPEGGLYHALMVVDLIIRDADGKIIAGQKAFGTFKFDSHEENMEVMAVVTVDFSDAPKGKYVLECEVADQLSDKTGTFELPFEIR